MSFLVNPFSNPQLSLVASWLPQLMTGVVAYQELVPGVLKAHHANKAHANSSIAGSCCLLDSLDGRGHVLHPEGTIQRHHHKVLPILPSQVGTCRSKPIKEHLSKPINPITQAQHMHYQLELEVCLNLACGVPTMP